MTARRRKATGLLTLFLLSIMSSLLLAPKSTAATIGTVTATSLNIRETASTSAKIVDTLKKGTSATIESTKKDTNFKSTSDTATFLQRMGYVNQTYLNLRKSASASSDRLAVIKMHQKVTVLEKKLVGSTSWYKIDVIIDSTPITGYVNAKYITLEKTTSSNTMEKLGSIRGNGTYLYQTANEHDEILETLDKGKEVICLATLFAGNQEWTKVRVKISDHKYTGYVLTSAIKNMTGTASSDSNEAGRLSEKTHLRTIASTISTSKGLLAADTKLTITNTIAVNNRKWYKCNVVIEGKKQTGYVLASKTLNQADLEFLKSIEAFPSSYRKDLEALHAKYPNWIFKPVEIKTTWAKALTLQASGAKNTLRSFAANGGSTGSNSAPLSYLSKDPSVYNASTNTFHQIADPYQYSVTKEVIAFYMDPRNFLTEKNIFMFENMKQTSAKKELTSILSNTFMDDRNYHSVFTQAGKDANISSVFLAARAINQLGSYGNVLSEGTSNDYKGYYNFFNIGSYDNRKNEYTYLNSLSYASKGTSYLRPWSTPDTSILGGAKYINTNFIKNGQTTIYSQKFDFVSGEAGTNQYTTDLKATSAEANRLYTAYKAANTLNSERTFYIPVFSKMPANKAVLPK